MISKQKLIAANSVSADASSTTKFSDTSPTCHSPQSRITQTHNEIRITSKHLIAQPIQLMLKLLPDVFGFLQEGIPGDALSLPATEVEKVVPGWVLLEDVSPVDLRVKVPYRRECPWVFRAVPFGEVGTVLRSEGDDLCVVEHPEQLRSGSTHKALTGLGLILALGFPQ